MNSKPEALNEGEFYHIYNRGNNNIDIFFDPGNFHYFLRLYQQYISPVADTLAWCLLKNHFHAFIYVKKKDEIQISALRYSTVATPRIIDASKQFSHLLNAYTQAINKRYSRTGSLFENPFRRKCVNETSIKEMTYYINVNPTLHNYTKNVDEYRWTSYNAIISDKPAFVNHEFLVNVFGGRTAFIDFHKQEQNLTKITKFIIE